MTFPCLGLTAPLDMRDRAVLALEISQLGGAHPHRQGYLNALVLDAHTSRRPDPSDLTAPNPWHLSLYQTQAGSCNRTLRDVVGALPEARPTTKTTSSRRGDGNYPTTSGSSACGRSRPSSAGSGSNILASEAVAAAIRLDTSVLLSTRHLCSRGP